MVFIGAMTVLPTRNPALTGILCALAGSAIFSINDVAIKSLSGAYALHQVILIRAVIGMAVLFALMTLTRADFRQLVTRRPGAHLLRVAFVMVSNVTYFLGLAALPLADAVAIAFVSPLIVTMLSVLVLNEPVGPRRWAAVAVGLIGVVVMLRPGSGVFQPAAILVLMSAFCYAATNLMTRRMKATESAFAFSFYIQIGFVIVSSTMGLMVGDGHLAGSEDPSMAFLLRGWVWPPVHDWPAFVASGISVATGGLLIAQAYRLGDAALIAPFEYAGMPFAIFWGVVMFNTWPDLTAWIGIALIIGAGLYTLWRETRVR
jgi:drug/metabolite transporter (DMT)-like permease